MQAVFNKPAAWFIYAMRNCGIHNLTDRSLTADQRKALGVGLAFILKPRPLSESQLKGCCATFARRVRLRWHFRHSQSKPPRFYVPNPSWEPDNVPAVLQSFTQHIEKTALERLHKAPRWHRPNVPPNVLQAWRSLAQDPELVITPADKNLGTVLSTRDQYDAAVQSHVANTHKYRRLTRNHAIAKLKRFAHRSVQIFSRLMPETDSTHKWYRTSVAGRLNNVADSIPRFYGVWKVHKAPLQLRPIVPSFNSVTAPASEYLDYRLRPLVERLWTVLPDSSHLVRELEETHFPQDATLLTLDVHALYPSIPHQDGVQKVAEICRRFPTCIPPEEVPLLCDLLSLVLTHNVLQVNGQDYVQVHGTAMGTSVAVAYANLFMFAVEDPMVSSLLKSGRVLLYRRYVDDLFVVLRGMRPTDFTTNFNQLHPDIAVTGGGGSEVDFLDLHIYKGPRWTLDRRFDLRTHQKRLNAYLYLPFSSYHSVASKKGFVCGELKRYVRTCSSAADFALLRTLFYRRLRNRGYPPSLLRRCFATVKYTSRHALLWPQPKAPAPPPLVLTVQHNPSLHDIDLASIVHRAYDALPAYIRHHIPRPVLALTNARKLGADAARQRTPRDPQRAPSEPVSSTVPEGLPNPNPRLQQPHRLLQAALR